ncbi:cytochrome b-c1 complex subunit 7-like [Dreissena polymorpha]|uniref:Cytochrome b-c1 complex subunit 7 n=1 Tax=Dreissena polymorpha TaxID=45954 RepID=A0A9D3Z7V0_DREPO|nr:cytochrome b-c1 complex subunit 7-like [Dreissena polymorpha]KAH3712346.1 hypothetical protein DPMN_072043 [Dreissena polymorpha]
MGILSRVVNSIPGLSGLIWRTAEFPKLGLMIHDLYCPIKSPVVKEAIKRLPERVAVERQLRISRAITLGMAHKHLPQEEWMTPEKNVPYMDEAIKQVEREMNLKAQLNEQIYSFKSSNLAISGSLKHALPPSK